MIDRTLARFLSSALLLALAAHHPVARAQDGREHTAVTKSLGLAALQAPAFWGDDQSESALLPDLRIAKEGAWAFSFAEGLTVSLARRDNLSTGLLIQYDLGRDDDAGDENDLVGLDDVDGTLELGGYVNYALGPLEASMALVKGLGGGHSGIRGSASIQMRSAFTARTRPVFVSVGPTLSFGDGALHDAYFAVSAAQASATGLSPYTAAGGVSSHGLAASVIAPLSERYTATAFVQAERLSGPLADASIVRDRGDRNQFTVAFALYVAF
ncbi:MAG: MipA/OmpV family protein [Pseudomonadota bacterium]